MIDPITAILLAGSARILEKSTGLLEDVILDAPAKDLIQKRKKQIVAKVRKKLGNRKNKIPTNHDLQRVLLLSICNAADQWIETLNGKYRTPEFNKNQRKDLQSFLSRMELILSNQRNRALDRFKPLEDQLDQTLIEGILKIPDQSFFENESALTKNITKSFHEKLVQHDGSELPESALMELYISENNIYKFGSQTLDQFIEIVKSSEYPEATKAYEYRLFSILKNEVSSFRNEFNRLFPQYIENIDHQLQQIQSLYGQVLEHAMPDKLVLNRKLSGRGLKSINFLEMRFEQRKTRFIAREKEIQKLNEFLNDDKPISWWQIAGGAGQGKSRLALHIVDTYCESWNCGFLENEDFLDDNTDWDEVIFSEPTLIVIDYVAAADRAQSFGELVHTLLERTADASKPFIENKIRIIVLEREPYDGYGDQTRASTSWFGQIEQSKVHSVLQTCWRSECVFLKDLDSSHILQISNSWRKSQDCAPLDDHQQHILLNLLRGATGSGERLRAWSPLLAMMISEHIDDFDSSEGYTEMFSILEKTFQAEQDSYWKNHDNKRIAPSQEALSLACLATVIDGYKHDKYIDILIKDEPPCHPANQFYGPFDSREHFFSVSMVLGYSCHPLQDNFEVGSLQPRQPDLLGEYLVLWALQRSKLSGNRNLVATSERIIKDSYRLNWSGAVSFLIRLNEDFPNHPICKVLNGITRPRTDPFEYEKTDILDEFEDKNGLIDKDAESQIAIEYNKIEKVKSKIETQEVQNVIFLDRINTNLLLASQTGQHDTVKVLTERGAAINYTSVDGNFPLLLAAENGFIDTTRFLIINGADVNKVNSTGISALLAASHNGHTETVEFLLLHGGDPNIVSSEGVFPLLVASAHGHLGIVRLLVNAGADVNSVHKTTGTFPILVAIENGHNDVVSVLVETDADLNLVNLNTGNFPLLAAAKLGNPSIVKTLLESNANLDQTNPITGEKPIDLAKNSKSKSLLQVFGKRESNKESDSSIPLIYPDKSQFLQEEIERVISDFNPDVEWDIPPLFSNSKILKDTKSNCVGDVSNSALLVLMAERMGLIKKGRIIQQSISHLSFYPNVKLIEILFKPENEEVGILTFAILNDSSFVLLDGSRKTSIDVLDKYQSENFTLDSSEIASAYLRFFCTAIQGELGVFHLVDTFEDLVLSEFMDISKTTFLSNEIESIKLVSSNNDGYFFQGIISYGSYLFKAQFLVSQSGQVEMIDDEPLIADIPIRQQMFTSYLRRYSN